MRNAVLSLKIFSPNFNRFENCIKCFTAAIIGTILASVKLFSHKVASAHKVILSVAINYALSTRGAQAGMQWHGDLHDFAQSVDRSMRPLNSTQEMENVTTTTMMSGGLKINFTTIEIVVSKAGKGGRLWPTGAFLRANFPSFCARVRQHTYMYNYNTMKTELKCVLLFCVSKSNMCSVKFKYNRNPRLVYLMDGVFEHTVYLLKNYFFQVLPAIELKYNILWHEHQCSHYWFKHF